MMKSNAAASPGPAPQDAAPAKPRRQAAAKPKQQAPAAPARQADARAPSAPPAPGKRRQRAKTRSRRPALAAGAGRARRAAAGAGRAGRAARRGYAGRRRSRRAAANAAPTAVSEAAERELEEPAARSYDEGYREGYHAGGEGLLEAHLPGDLLLPNVTIEEVLSAGVAAVRPRGIPLLGAAGVFEEIERAMAERKPYALVRLGDGELLTLAQDTVMPADEVRREGAFLPYAGVEPPDLRARDEVAAAMRLASLVGVPQSRKPHYQPLLFAVWQAYGIQPESLRLTSSTVNYSLYNEGYIARLIDGRRVLLIGNVAEPLGRVLAERGANIAGTVSPVRGMNDLDRVVEEASGYTFDLALVSAGIAAVPICVRLANRTGKVAIDFGHMANVISGVGGHPARRS